MLTNLHVLHLPESEKHNLGIMSVCEHDNSKTISATEPPNFAPAPPNFAPETPNVAPEPPNFAPAPPNASP
ncbi:hypothetical protein AVEN_176798-1 [Araneus ventricosus]|uniref:Uncharacterized protein n=1 Tax=Araneus ventricosus TaxID=182803 RepID=A0A4Y2HTC5_ARAVE|nr:hypothetical protein AVEN_269908-1 [Araneus ventricosus]GBM68667.1 hypothetical protein AVEN_129831-1 [Araneus ventricosus]GBM68685.1 hypothetical protein AVEN_168315-1 [Araneus ventricosus]GBM68696.1 hypothetical protein AVEN_176798-1 [Araneus ventricosus]